MPLPERVRVKSKKTGHEFTRSAAWYEAHQDAVTLLEDKPATHLDGTDVAMKPSESIDAAGARQRGQSLDGYDAKTIADLTTEISTRNEGRDEADLITPDGPKKADLIAALVADDTKENS